MFFVVRFAVVVLLICFALDWRVRGAAPHAVYSQETKKTNNANASSTERTVAAGISAARAGVDALTRAAEQKCAASPADCVAVARRLRSLDGR